MHEHTHQLRNTRYLGIALGITISFFIIELVGGILTNSLALLTDAWHMLNDVFALSLGLVAAWLALRPPTVKRTYGYYRAEILAAFLNGVFLWVIVVFVFYEAIQRIQQPSEVQSLRMLIIAISGLAANGLSAFVLSRSKDESLNIRGAFLHVVADTLGSVGAISAGLIMFFTGWYQVDSLISMMIGLLIFYSSGKLIRDSMNVLLEGVPPHIDLGVLERRIVELKEVKKVHDLHVWCITPTKMCCMSGHVVVKEGTDRRKLMENLIDMLREEFEIDHTTIQLEEEDYPKAVGEH
ncbi:MAG: cation diffusion facilitator family transporter [Nitrososphaeria archaeon]|nr:cation diffusion facilitator family transporter [Nitrososphaeria archaeon]NIN53303.1 cation diffusion facilitator family transporter [Nitrososphaeria archaeon]NIQ33756.1 cation diffusion facilitator family transporter [Nitrososphaeria archaeon]